MTDNEAEKADPAATPEDHALHVAKPGVKDKGEVVSSAVGEPIEGIIADIADGD